MSGSHGGGGVNCFLNIQILKILDSLYSYQFQMDEGEINLIHPFLKHLYLYFKKLQLVCFELGDVKYIQ